MTVSAILRELFGLFVDDGSLAINLLVWTGVAGGALALFTGGGAWQAPLMVAGYLAILIENVLRAVGNGGSS